MFTGNTRSSIVYSSFISSSSLYSFSLLFNSSGNLFSSKSFVNLSSSRNRESPLYVFYNSNSIYPYLLSKTLFLNFSSVSLFLACNFLFIFLSILDFYEEDFFFVRFFRSLLSLLCFCFYFLVVAWVGLSVYPIQLLKRIFILFSILVCVYGLLVNVL